jgi:protoporphyrin/coproporphyrin ferrochelatase
VVCACGFVADHLEVAYDLDVEAAALAAELEIPFARTGSVNDDTAVMAALAELVAGR